VVITIRPIAVASAKKTPVFGLILISMVDQYLKSAHYIVCCVDMDVDKGREQDAVSFVDMDVDKGREQDAVSFADMDVGKGREQDAVSFGLLN
jgi:hypothetical protein